MSILQLNGIHRTTKFSFASEELPPKFVLEPSSQFLLDIFRDDPTTATAEGT